MIQMPAKRLGSLMVLCCAVLSVAHAADPLPAQTRLAAASTAAVTEYGTQGNLPPQFTIATTQDLVVTLNFSAGSGTGYGPPVSAGVVVTQAGAIAASTLLAAPATTATASISAASGIYTLYVFGVPDAGTGRSFFSVCVAPKASASNCIASASLSGNITVQSTAKDPTVSTLSTPLTVATPGSYTFTFGDLRFPVALNVAPTLALFQGSTPICPPGVPISGGVCTNPAITSGTTFPNLLSGTYQLLAIAQADPTVKSGLYGITVTGAAGSTPLLDVAVPVGLTPAVTTCGNTSASVTLKVTDYVFPAQLASASALLTAGGTVVGTANAAGGAVILTAPAATLNLWTYGSAGTGPGTLSADVAGTTNPCTAAQAVQSPGSTYAYAFVAPIMTAGPYQATAADLQFPSQLSGLSFEVAQNGVILQKSATAATVNFNAVAGNTVLLVSAQTPASSSASGNGLFDVNVQSTGASAQLVYDKTQSVSSSGALFDSQQLVLGVNAGFDVTLTDLQFPAAFDNLAFVLSRGSEVLGKIYGGGTFSFAGSAGNYQLTFVGTPAAQQQFGLYGVSVVYSPPAIILTSSVSSAAIGAAVQLNWSTTNATSCTASGGSWTGSKATSTSMESVALAATTTYTLSCTGGGGTTSKSVTVTATVAPAKSGGGGGSIDPAWLIVGSGLLVARLRRRRQ